MSRQELAQSSREVVGQAESLWHHPHGTKCDLPAEPGFEQDANFPPVFLCSASNHEGVRELADALEAITARKTDDWRANRRRQALAEIRQAIMEEVRQRVSDVIGTNGASEIRTLPLLAGEVSLKNLVDEVLQESVRRAGLADLHHNQQ